jgi:hypothetical protein
MPLEEITKQKYEKIHPIKQKKTIKAKEHNNITITVMKVNTRLSVLYKYF